MNTKYYQDIEQIIVSARKMNDAEFDRMAKKYLTEISEEEKDEFCKALTAFHVDRINQYMEINKELAMIMKSVKTKETVNMFEMAC
jgi:predicted type IV restriction endonuclease